MARTKYPKSRPAPAWLLDQEAERVAIVGSRRYPRLGDVAIYVGGLKKAMTLPEHQPVVVTGTDPEKKAAQGVDSPDGVDETAYRAATAHGLKVDCKHPEVWRTQYLLGRNRQIVAACSRLVAFWDHTDPRSTGTAYTIREAIGAGKDVLVFGPEGDVLDVEVVDGRVRVKGSGRKHGEAIAAARHEPGDTLIADDGFDIAAALGERFAARRLA